jgi:hypothetical protein
VSRKALFALVVLQAAIGFFQHRAVFGELSSFAGDARTASTAVTWPPGSSVLLVAAIVLIAFLVVPRRAGELASDRAGRIGAAGLTLVAALGLFHVAIGLVAGRLTLWLTVPFLLVCGAAAIGIRRFAPGNEAALDAAQQADGFSWWDVASAVLLLTSFAAMTFPYAFEDARAIWGCRAFALDSTGTLAGLASCSHRNYPPLLSVLLWMTVRDPLFQGRLLVWLSLVLFVLFFRSRLRAVAPDYAAPALLFFVSTVHVWEGTATIYADAPLMIFLSAGTLLVLGRPGLGDGPPVMERVAGSLCLAAAVLIRPDGFYYLAVVAAAVVVARVLWRERFPWAVFLLPIAAATAWDFRPAALSPPSRIAAAYSGSFLGNATGEWRGVAETAGAAFWKVMIVLLHAWQGQWLSHKGLGFAIYLLVGVTIVAARRGVFSGGADILFPETRLAGLVTLGGLLAVVVCFAAVPFVSDPVGAVQPFAGDYLACYRNFVRVGLGRMTVHLYPVACLFVVGLLTALGRTSDAAS